MLFRSYCGGCRARSLAYTGDIQAGDPGCIYNAPHWDEVNRETDRMEVISAGSRLVQIDTAPAASRRAAMGD